MPETVKDTMDDVLACVVAGLSDVDRPVARSGKTVGPPMLVGPLTCCVECSDCGENANGQATIHLERVYPTTGDTLEQDSTRVESCRKGPLAADLVVVVARCYPTLTDTGELPSLEDTGEAADGLSEDVSAIWSALQCCGFKLVIRESGVDSDPEGGCSAFSVRFSVPVKLK